MDRFFHCKLEAEEKTNKQIHLKLKSEENEIWPFMLHRFFGNSNIVIYGIHLVVSTLTHTHVSCKSGVGTVFKYNSIAYAVVDIVELVEFFSSSPLSTLHLDASAFSNNEVI